MRDAQGNRDVINQRNTYGAIFNTEWKFLPKTALVLDGIYAVNDWEKNQIETTEDVTTINDSTSWDAKFGLQGQVSADLVRLMAVQVALRMEKLTLLMLLSWKLITKIAFGCGYVLGHLTTRYSFEYKRAFQDVLYKHNLYHQIGLTWGVLATSFQSMDNTETTTMTDQWTVLTTVFRPVVHSINFAEHVAFDRVKLASFGIS